MSDVASLVSAIEERLADSLVSVYRFGSNFARGPRAPEARLLILVEAIDDDVLEATHALALEAREANVSLRFDTPSAVEAGADVFPIFVLELIDTMERLSGEDRLASLELSPAHLGLRAEQVLRVLHRDLLRAYVEATDDARLARELRAIVRRAIYLLRALAIVYDVELDDPPTVRATIERVVGQLLPASDLVVWERLRAFAGFERSLEHGALITTVRETLTELDRLVEVADQRPT